MDNDDAKAAWPLLLTAHAVLVQDIERRLAAARLPALSWYEVLSALEDAGGRLRMHELADRVVLTRSNLTRLIDRLAALGHVTREKDADDRRGAYAVLNDSGAQLRARIAPVYLQAVAELFEDRTGPAERAAMARTLRTVLSGSRERD
jgi:DNA-binding MarR family transcriptional regulator